MAIESKFSPNKFNEKQTDQIKCRPVNDKKNNSVADNWVCLNASTKKSDWPWPDI